MANQKTSPVSVDTTAIRLRETKINKLSILNRLTEPLALIATLVILSIIFTVLNPRFASPENFVNLLNQASLPLILGVGATLVILLGSIDLSIEGVMGASAMAFVLLSANTRGSGALGHETANEGFGVLAIIVAILVGVLFGSASGAIVTKAKVPSFVVTLGMWFVGLGLATILFGTETIPFLSDPAVSGWASALTAGIPNSFWAAVVVVAIGSAVLGLTRIGRSVLAIGNNETIARNSGLKVDRIKIMIFGIAGGLSGVGGIIAAIKLGSGSPHVGIGTLFIVIPAVVIGGTSLGGGRGGIMRTALAVLLLTVLNNGLILAGVSPNYQSGIAGAIVIAAIIFAASSQRDRLRIAK
jgi:ribose transport system permease protein